MLNLYKDIIISKCKLCGKEYIKKHSRHYFCCAKCKRKYDESIRNNKYICNNCGKEFTTYQYKHGLSFCSHKCSVEYHSKIAKEVRKCEWCNNDFICNRSETKRFCCMKCQSMWQKYVFQDEEHKEISRSRTINMLKNGNNMNKFSKPHQKMSNILQENNINFKNEVRVGNFLIDIVVEDKYYIEIMGDYWHMNPNKYDSPNNQQERGVYRDTLKYKYFIENNIPLLCIWECDINKNLNKILNLLNEFKNCENGIIHSYNYFNNTNIIPYAEKQARIQLGSPEVDDRAQG